LPSFPLLTSSVACESAKSG